MTERGYRPEGYPKMTITFRGFNRLMFNLFIHSCQSEEEFMALNKVNEWYLDYKEGNYRTKLSYIEKHGYQSVTDWAYEHFQEWELGETSMQLKPITDKEGYCLYNEHEVFNKPELMKPVLLCIKEQDDEVVVAYLEKDGLWTIAYTGERLRYEGDVYWKDCITYPEKNN